MGRQSYISSTLKENELPIVYLGSNPFYYSNSYTNESSYEIDKDNSDDENSEEDKRMLSRNAVCKYYIVLSQSQGFNWNQDLFVSQYQQNYKVEFDAQEDSLDNYLMDNSLMKNRYRRKSSNCISLENENQQGVWMNSGMNDIRIIDISKDNTGSDINDKELENIAHLHWLCNG